LEHSASDDEIREKIDALFVDEGQVGPKPSDEHLAERLATVNKRYEEEVPPGFKDASKKEGREGDLLVWYEILAYANKSDRPMLFVTSDTKEDWYERESGKTAGPRRELRIEMMKKTAHPYHQVSLNRFLELANKHLSANVKTDTIQVVDEISEQRRAESKLMSQLRHPGILARFDRALEVLKPGTADYRTVVRAREVVNGERPFDSESAKAALAVLREFSDYYGLARTSHADRRMREARARRARKEREEEEFTARVRELSNMLLNPEESGIFIDAPQSFDEVFEWVGKDPERAEILAEELVRLRENDSGDRKITAEGVDIFEDEERIPESDG
jgi:hypothetical protein